MDGPPTVLYVGPDPADREAPDGLAVEWATPEELPAALGDHGADAVVVHSDGTVDLSEVVERVRDRSELLPVVVLDSVGSVSPAAVSELGVTHVLCVDSAFDRAATLADLRGLLERARETRRDRTMLDSLLTNVPLSIYFKDRQSRHVRVSDEMLEMTGPPYIESPDGKRHHAPTDVRSKTDYDLYPPELAEAAVDDDTRVVEGGASIEDRTEHAYGDDLAETYVATSKAPWTDETGEVLGVVGVTRDITDRETYERQLERQNEQLERFASVISHDLRNPLEVALGRLEFAREEGDAAHFDAVERSLERIDSLIEDVLTLARQGATVSDPVSTELAAAARDAWAVVETADATLSVDTDATLLADPSRLQQLLENAFRNAVEHAGPEVAVTVGDLDDREGFFIADDGPGIPAEERETVFESGYSTADDGNGLGLNIVRTVADAHGWAVDVTDSADGGARFEFGASPEDAE